MLKKLGIPVKKFISASNKNKVLADFFKSGTYDKNRDFYTTNSHLWIFFFHQILKDTFIMPTGENSARTKELIDSLLTTGVLSVSPEELAKIRKNFMENLLTAKKL